MLDEAFEGLAAEVDEVISLPDDDDMEHATLSPEKQEQRRLGRRPDISGLSPAVVKDPGTGDMVPLFDVGDRIIVERFTDLLDGCPWLDTRLLHVINIDDDTGVVHCLDPEFNHHTFVGFKHPLQNFRLPARHGNPFRAPAVTREVTTVEVGGNQPEPGKKRGRGRPKGSKNRPKEVVQAEKQARRASVRKRRSKRL